MEAVLMKYMHYMVLALGLVLLILGAVSHGSASKLSDSTEKKNIKNSNLGVIVIGILLLLLGLYGVYTSMMGDKKAAVSYYF